MGLNIRAQLSWGEQYVNEYKKKKPRISYDIQIQCSGPSRRYQSNGSIFKNSNKLEIHNMFAFEFQCMMMSLISSVSRLLLSQSTAIYLESHFPFHTFPFRFNSFLFIARMYDMYGLVYGVEIWTTVTTLIYFISNLLIYKTLNVFIFGVLVVNVRIWDTIRKFMRFTEN